MREWWPVLLASGGCYLLKLAGLSVPRRLLQNPRVRATAELLPVALLAALVAVQGFTTGHRPVVDTRAAGLAAAALALLLRAPFLLVVGVAALTTALLRVALH